MWEGGAGRQHYPPPPKKKSFLPVFTQLISNDVFKLDILTISG